VEFEDHAEHARILMRQAYSRKGSPGVHGVHEGKTPIAQDMYTTRGDWHREETGFWHRFVGERNKLWYVIGWGEEVGGNKWLVVWHESFRDWIDILSSDRKGLKREAVEGIQASIAKFEIARMKKEAAKFFPVPIDNAREKI